MSRVKVTINKKGHIPKLGLGPIRRPVLITKELYDQLVKLGYPVKIVQSSIEEINTKNIVAHSNTSNKVKEVEEKIETVIETNTVEVQEEPAVEEVITNNEEVVEVITENENIEEITEEVLVDDPDLSAEAFYTEGFLTSKAVCKKILAARQVQYEDSASFALLKKLVNESNPEVEFTEE